MRWIYVSLIILLLAVPAQARRISRPDSFKLPWTEEQVTDISNTLEDIFNMQKGRYEHDIVSTTKSNPNDGEMWITTGIVGAVALTGQIAEVDFRAGGVNYTLSPDVYGEIYAKDNSATTTLTANSVFVQVPVFDKNGYSSQTTPDHTSDDITIKVAGKYLATVSVAIANSAGAAHEVVISLRKNSGSSTFNNVHANRNLANSTDVGSISLSGIINVVANDTIELWATTTSGSNRNVTFSDITLSLVRIGP
jgi:hypothetical protein